MEPAGLEPATSRSQVDNPPPSARGTRTRSGEGVSALPAELRPLRVVLCCVWVARRNARPWHRESRVHVLRAPRPPATLSTAWLLPSRPRSPPPRLVVGPQTKIAPPGLCAGGAIASLPGCGKGHALKAPTLPELPRWLSLRPSCSRAVACRCHGSRLRNRTARRARRRVRRTSARPRPADRRTPATPRATRNQRPSADCRRVCRASEPASVPCRRFGVSAWRDGPAGNAKSRRRCPPAALASGSTPGPVACTGPWWTVEHRDATP